MNTQWLLALLIIWVTGTIGAIEIDTPEIYLASMFGTIVWGIVLAFVREMEVKLGR